MPLRSDVFISNCYGRTAPLGPYGMVLSTQRERDAASVAVDRLIDAGLSYPKASAAARELRRATARAARRP
jgi:hypothetical protein